MKRIILLLVLLHGAVSGAGEVAIDKFKDKVKEADAVVEGKVVYTETIYQSQGKILTKWEATDAIIKYGAILNELMAKRNDKKALREVKEAFKKTKEGKIIEDLSWLILSGVKVEKVHKGEVKPKIIFCARSVKFDLKTFNSENFRIEGEKVMLYLLGEWNTGVVNGENFLIDRVIEPENDEPN